MALCECTTCSPSNAKKASAICLNKMAICYQTVPQREQTCTLSSSPQARFGLGNLPEYSAFADIERSGRCWIRPCTIGEQLRAHRTPRIRDASRWFILKNAVWAKATRLRVERVCADPQTTHSALIHWIEAVFPFEISSCLRSASFPLSRHADAALYS